MATQFTKLRGYELDFSRAQREIDYFSTWLIDLAKVAEEAEKGNAATSGIEEELQQLLKHRQHYDELTNVLRGVDISNVEEISANWEQLTADLESKCQDLNVLSHAKYKDLQKAIKEVHQGDMMDEDEDLIVSTQTQVSLLCPILRAKYVDPVKSKGCGHTFSRKGIESMFQRKSQIKCPVHGCRKPILKSDLETDTDMLYQLDYHQDDDENEKEDVVRIA